MTDLARAAALVLAAVFAWAAVAKLRDRDGSARAFRGFGLPAAGALTVAVPVVEVVLAVGLVLEPALAAFVALLVLLAFSVVVGLAVARGSTVGCACFGGASADRPVSVVELVRNGGLAALAVVATAAGGGSALWPALPAAVVVTVVVAVARVALAAATLRLDGGHLLATPLPGEPAGDRR